MGLLSGLGAGWSFFSTVCGGRGEDGGRLCTVTPMPSVPSRSELFPSFRPNVSGGPAVPGAGCPGLWDVAPAFRSFQLNESQRLGEQCQAGFYGMWGLWWVVPQPIPH